jgi:glucose/arabinose dehydrogenase
MAFLPDGDLIFTEKAGTIWRQKPNCTKSQVAGAPAVMSEGQGGLLDVELHPKFAENKLIYFTYSKPQPGGDSQTVGHHGDARAPGGQSTDRHQGYLHGATLCGHLNITSAAEWNLVATDTWYVTVGERGKQDEFPQVLGQGTRKGAPYHR